MSDLGQLNIAIGNMNSLSLLTSKSVAGGVDAAYTNVTLAPSNGFRQGVVKVNGSPMPNVMVGLYCRDNGQLLSRQLTKMDGSYRFDGLDPSVDGFYFIVAHDPSSVAPFNYTLSQDHLTAIPE